MSTSHWIKRFTVAFLVGVAVLFAAELLKGRAVIQAAEHAAVWGLVVAGIFTGVGYLRYRRNPACMVKPGSKDK